MGNKNSTGGNRMGYMETYKKKFQELDNLNKKYNLDGQDIGGIIKEIEEYRVTTPIVGNFSTGKSSIINAILGKGILGVEITPETAIPTEIFYGPDRIMQYGKDFVKEHLVEELPLKNLSVKDTEYVTIEYNHPFLKEIKNVSLVDLPGFDSSIELHNHAIDQFLPRSVAYVLVIAADEPVLKETMSSFLKELTMHDMPVYIVLTKCNRLLESELEECRKLVYQLVYNIIEKEDIKMTCADSYGQIKVEGVKEFLREIEEKTEELFCNKYKEVLRRAARNTELYLLERIDKRNLSSSELEYEQERLEKKIENLRERLDKEKSLFEEKMFSCISLIEENVKKDLNNSIEELSVLIENGVDITEKINTVVRSAISFSIKTELEPKLQQYVNRVTDIVDLEISNQDQVIEEMKQKVSEVNGIDKALKAAPAVLAGVGLVLGNVFGGILGGILGSAADSIYNSNWSKRREREAGKAAKKVVEAIEEEASTCVTNEIKGLVLAVNQQLENEIGKKQSVLKNSLRDIKEELKLQEGFKKSEVNQLQEDLSKVREIIDSVIIVNKKKRK